MNLRTRQAIATLFLVGFAITAPIVLLNTKGYRYNWSKNRMEKTGILKFGSKPTGAEIFVNGVLQTKTTPSSIFRVLPEDYDVRLEKTGYFPWQKTLSVKSGEMTFTQDVVLLKRSLPSLAFSGDVAASSWSADGRLTALVRRVEDWLELGVYHWDGGGADLLARFSADKYVRTEIAWSPNGDALLFQAAIKDGGTELFLYPLPPGGEIRALHLKLPQDGRLSARWSTDGRSISAVTKHGAFVVDPFGDAIAPMTLSPRIQDAAIVGSDAYLLETESDKVVLERTSVDRPDAPVTLADLPAGQYSFTDANDRYLALTDRGPMQTLLIDRADGRIAATFNALRLRWERSAGEGRLLLWNDFEIYIHDPDVGQPQLITRLGVPLLDCAWHPGGQDIIFATPETLTAIELDDRDRRNTYELTRLTAIGGFFIDNTEKRLLFSGAAGNQSGLYELGF